MSASAGVADVAIPPGSLLAWSHALSDSFTETQQQFPVVLRMGRLSHPFAYFQQVREGIEFAHSGERTEGEPRRFGLALEQGSR